MLRDQDWEDYILELAFLSKSFKFQVNSENCNETKPCVKQAPTTCCAGFCVPFATEKIN